MSDYCSLCGKEHGDADLNACLRNLSEAVGMETRLALRADDEVRQLRREVYAVWAVAAGLSCTCDRLFATDGAAGNPNMHDDTCRFVRVAEEVAGKLADSEY